jgi:hypothetical protein
MAVAISVGQPRLRGMMARPAAELRPAWSRSESHLGERFAQTLDEHEPRRWTFESEQYYVSIRPQDTSCNPLHRFHGAANHDPEHERNDHDLQLSP